MRTEALVETAELSIVRVHGRPREPEQGRHRKAVVFVGVEQRLTKESQDGLGLAVTMHRQGLLDAT